MLSLAGSSRMLRKVCTPIESLNQSLSGGMWHRPHSANRKFDRRNLILGHLLWSYASLVEFP